MELIGHRGGAALAPENTLAAIRAGLAAGADGVEVDARTTADGAIVLMHDRELGRTTNGNGPVSSATLEQVRALDAGYRFSPDGAFPARGAYVRVPTLDEALAAVPVDRLLIVEAKGTPWEDDHDPSEPLARALAARLAAEPPRRLCVSSFNPAALEIVGARCPGVRTAVLTARGFDAGSNLAAAIAGGHDECHVPAELVNPAFVADAHAVGKRVFAWTVDDPMQLRSFLEWGVDAAICDDPGAARRAITP